MAKSNKAIYFKIFMLPHSRFNTHVEKKEAKLKKHKNRNQSPNYCIANVSYKDVATTKNVVRRLKFEQWPGRLK